MNQLKLVAMPPENLPWIRIRSEQYTCIAKGSAFSNTSYTAIFESNSATCLCDHCSLLQRRDDTVFDFVEKYAHYPMCACLSSMISTGYPLYKCDTIGVPTSSVALEIVNVVCRLKLRDESLG